MEMFQMITRRLNHALRQIILVLAFMAIIPGCAGLEGPTKPAAVPEIHPGILVGYLDSETLPDSLALISPHPAEGSAGLALDEEVSQKSLALQ
jgi:acid phosphatase (class A)